MNKGLEAYLPKVREYLRRQDWSDIPALARRNLQVLPLAQGEYNLNFRLTGGGPDLVFRVNMGTQIGREDQVVYEFKTLKLLQESGVTPLPVFVDDSRSLLDRGILIMTYLPGEALDYRRDIPAAARLFSTLHQIPVASEKNHLIREESPLTLLYEECRGLLQQYFDSPLADPNIRSYLKMIGDWANEARHRERYFQQDPWNCVLNTEVNNRNFIANRTRKTLHLVDWEMPRWGDPSQDLSHFCSPLTTLWKTDFRMRHGEKEDFIAVYSKGVADRHLADTLRDRIRLRDPFVYLRGISWSAMGWVQYQSDFSGNRNPDTWTTLQRYMNLNFLRSLFDPFLTPARRSSAAFP